MTKYLAVYCAYLLGVLTYPIFLIGMALTTAYHIDKDMRSLDNFGAGEIIALCVMALLRLAAFGLIVCL